MSALHHEDLLNYLINLENETFDPEMKHNIQTLRLLTSILSPFLRFLLEWHCTGCEEVEVNLKHMVDVVQKVSWAFELRPLPRLSRQADDAATRNAKLVASSLENFRSLKENMDQIVSFHTNSTSFLYVTVKMDDVERVAGFFDSLSKFLKDVRSICGDKTIIRVKKVADVEERLKFLINFLWLSAKPPRWTGTWRRVARCAQTLAVKFSHSLFLFFGDDKLVADDHMQEDIFQDVLKKISTLMLELKQTNDKIRLVKSPYWYPTNSKRLLGFIDHLIHKLRKLLNNKASVMVASVKVQIDILVEELRFIRSSNLMDMLSAYSSVDINITISIQALIIYTGFFVYFALDKVGDDELIMANYLSFGLPDLLEAVDNFHQQARDTFQKYIPQAWQSNRSGINEIQFVNFLVEKLEELLDCKAASIDPLKCQIKMAYEEMVTLRKCFCEMAGLMGNSQLEFLLTRFRLAAYQAEYVINSLMNREGLLWFHNLGIFVITQDIKTIQKEVKIISETNLDDDMHSIFEASTSTQICHQPSTNAPASSKNEMQTKIEEDANQLVGRKDAIAEIICRLTQGSEQLNIITIVGMPGIGKTTLANSVFKHPSVHVNFHVRAWCCLSQVYQKETLLSSILGQICKEKTNQSHEISGEDFAQMLYKSLKGRKYLIVIDDIWDIEAWVDLRECFPDDANGSRILFTTRFHDLAVKANSFPYALRLLSTKESCELLWLKLFKGETCPGELLSISKRIAKSCKGLPLAVVLIAGTLNRTTAKESWAKVAKTLMRSHSIQEQILDILEVSYKHLPDHLKPCFSYFGMFPEGTTILASKLICLWISEGFVKLPHLGQKSLKQEGERYLNDLIARSLVMITKKSSKGGAKACCVHDALREFCLSKLEKEKFVMREQSSSGISVLYGDFKMHKQYLSIFPTTKKHIRSLLYYYESHTDEDCRGREDLHEQNDIMNWPRGKRGIVSYQPEFRNLISALRPRFTEPGPRTSKFRQLDYGSILKYKYLGVLDLGNFRIQNSADTSDIVKISQLVHLRYLALRVRAAEIPSEIGNLRKLETFVLSGAVGKVLLPESIWELVSLRHIKMEYSFFSFQYYSQEFFENPSQLDNLTSISTLYMCRGNIEKFIRRLPRVQKLGCIFSNSWQDYYEACNLFKVLEFLCELQSLKMSFHARAPYPFKFSFPSNLKKLTMSGARLPWNEISVIGQLPNLEVLKLTNRAFEGQVWDMREGEFQKLKFLKLDSLDIGKWDASSEHLPCLEQLVVLSCQQLEEIPSCFGQILTLQLIEMKWCSPSASDSVKQILEEQRDLSNDQFNVIVVYSQLDMA